MPPKGYRSSVNALGAAVVMAFVAFFPGALNALAQDVEPVPADADPHAPPDELSANPDRDFHHTLGLMAFEQEDFERAFSYFARALRSAPDDTALLVAFAESAIHLERWDRAISALRRALRIDPVHARARFLVGLIAYRQGRYRDALDSFDGASDAGFDEPMLRFYRGASRFKIGEWESARRDLEFAVAELPETHPNSRFYLGVTYFELEDYREAVDELEIVVDTADDPALERVAARILDEAQARARRYKWWEIGVELGAAYDTNVLYEPADDIVAGEDGAYAFGMFEGTVYPWRTPDGYVGAGFHFFQSVHLADQDDAIREFDLLVNAFSLDSQVRVRHAMPEFHVGIGYEISDVFLGTDRYEVAQEIEPSATLVESARTATRASVAFRQKAFPDFDARDGVAVEPTVAQLFEPARPAGAKAAIELGYLQNSAASDLYDYYGGRLFYGMSVPLRRDLTSSGAVEFRYQDYVNHIGNRRDQRLSLDLGLRYDFVSFIYGQLMFRHARNDSLSDYRWQKNVVAVAFGAAF
ncbi:tetratricopeptide repeat protein [bacterium]|nr:tetratricopeptide repeat protein [bacterium]